MGILFNLKKFKTIKDSLQFQNRYSYFQINVADPDPIPDPDPNKTNHQNFKSL
jgi:hypothetical protein